MVVMSRAYGVRLACVLIFPSSAAAAEFSFPYVIIALWITGLTY